MYSLGQKIREIRLQKRMTQIDLAQGLCTPSMISQIESDRAKPSYKILCGISERLGVPLEHLLSDVNLNQEYVATYKMARAMVSGKEYQSAIPLLEQLMTNSQAQIPTTDIMFDLAESYIYTDRTQDAEALLSQLLETAFLRGDHHLSARVYKNLGQLELLRKRYQLAAFHWHKALDEAEKMEEQDLYLKAGILFDLGEAYSRSGQVCEALDYYERSSELYASVNNLHEMANVYLNLGISYRKLNDLEKAAEYSEKAIYIFEGLNNLVMMAKLQVTCAVLYGQTGREAEAIPMLQKAVENLIALSKPEEAGMAAVELATLQLKHGDISAAEDTCHEARKLLPELHMYQARVHRLYGKIASLNGHRDEAIRRYQKAADRFKHTDELGEWGDTMQELAELYKNEGDLKSAVRILQEIRGYTRDAMLKRGIAI
jgi:tetratricopeptide (TPR) repeat protein